MWKFEPILKQTVWGGNRIATFKGEPASSDTQRFIGETYELSGMSGYMSTVASGEDAGLSLNDLISKYGASLLGEKISNRFGNEFPLLVKFLDARQDLSIQVHPDDKTAPLFELTNGKSELWYVLQAEPDARLCAGFKEPLSRQEYINAVADGSIEKKLNYMPVKPGDVFYIPGGTVHSLCKGCLVLEIQQPSDTTFRIYDYGRRDLDGNLRQLHTEQALQALDLNSSGSGQILYPDERETPSGLIATRHFTVNRLCISYRHNRDYKDVDSFKVLTVVSGTVDISDSMSVQTATPGTVLLVAANERKVSFNPHGAATIIETYI
ncbi:MAG: class I mannose-6-phosphate isomerase [Prevotella sp.]|nr:class I mannose-6-phosphate isomerase [Prevotella sp.]MCM1074623.1 class I mannose-6-phosphate isomerase [Ruminococcus sp.]